MLSLTSVIHYYTNGPAISLPDIRLERGEQLLVLGPSGSGKTTLLHILAGILKPTYGEYVLDGNVVNTLTQAQLDALRGQQIGMVFQRPHLIDVLSVEENLILANYMAGNDQVIQRAKELLDRLEILDKRRARVSELSEGQKQRVSIARALMNEPMLLLADEPTSALDDKRADIVTELLISLTKEQKSALLITTHDQRIRSRITNVVELNGLANTAASLTQEQKETEK